MTNDNPSAAGKASQSKAYIHPREMVAASLALIGLSRFTCESPILLGKTIDKEIQAPGAIGHRFKKQ
jgi:hypothetical protein